jgi:hypothetical protein
MFEKLAKTGRASSPPEMMGVLAHTHQKKRGVGHFVKRFQRLG